MKCKEKNWKEIRKIINELNYKELVKALVSYEKGINNEKKLNKIYEKYMENDCCCGLFDMNYILEECDY